MMKQLKKIMWVLFLTLLLIGVPKLSGITASLFDYNAIDPDEAYAWISVHHIVQALIFIGIMFGIKHFKPFPFGFGWGDKKAGLHYVLKFTLIFGVGSLVSHGLAILTNSFHPFTFPLTATNIIGQMGFQLLLSGPSEELIFRAFAITMIALLFKNRLFNKKASSANIIAALIFGLAHVGFSFAPFAISYSLYQVILAIILGLFYGDCYEKTKSVYYPMMMHSISNIIMVGLSIITTFLF